MKGKTHAGIGAVSYMVIYDKLPGKFSYLAIFLVVVGSIFPDVDHPKSIINKYILPIKNNTAKVMVYVCLGIVILWYNYMILRSLILWPTGLAFILIGISSHRNGLTHSLLGMIAFSFMVNYISTSYQIQYITNYFMIGYGLHLICDMATKRGVSLFYPFRNKKVKLPFTYNSNSKTANIIEDLIAISGLFYVVFKLYKMQ